MVQSGKHVSMTLKEFLDEWNNESETLLVHTSGSTGSPKPLIVEKKKMEASAHTTCDFLDLKPGDTTLLCMPLDYIAGKMVVVRSVVRKLKLISVKPSGHPLSALHEAPTFAAMTPMQVFNSLQVPHECNILRQIKHLIIGGGAVNEDLEKELRDFPNAVWSTYGMTETLSHIALRRLSGEEASKWYTPFEGVSVSVNRCGCLLINAPSVCNKLLVTNDIAEITPDRSHFRILGRKDNTIDCGGIKIQMELVEEKLRKYISVPYMITKRSDNKFGEIVVIIVQTDDINGIRKICEHVLTKYWQPRLYIPVKSIPLTETGKPARASALKIAADVKTK